MGLKDFTLPWNKNKSHGPKTVHIFLGFFLIVNFCLGTGFLGIPYSFYYSGYLAAIPTLLLIAIVSCINATYIVECMARAQALETHRKCQEANPASDSESEGDKQLSQSLYSDRSMEHPNFEITVYRKFEQVEMCELFFNRWVKYLYLIILSIYSFLATWSFCTVAGSAWAVNIPFNFSNGAVQQCKEDFFQHAVLPEEESCRNAYYFCLFLFGVIVIILSLLDLKEQALVQMFLGLLRFVTVAAIVIYCIVRLAEGDGDKCLVNGAFNQSLPILPNVTLSPSIKGIILKFDGRGWMTAIPVFTYAFILHQGIPSLSHPIRQKKHLRAFFILMFTTAAICYFSLGIVVPLWFKSDIQETCTLNWAELTTPANSIQLRLLSYYIILFPSLDVMSAYPLCVHTVVNSIYIIITGRDSSKKPLWKCDLLLRLTLRLVAAVLPILAAFGVANLISVLKYAGLFGFAICFGFPTALQLRSIFVCKNRFARPVISVSGKENGQPSSPMLQSKELDGHLHRDEEKSPLLSVQELEGKDKRSLYMTPYSNRIFSHPIAVIIVGVIGTVLFVLTFASLFVHPSKETCYHGLDELRMYDEL